MRTVTDEYASFLALYHALERSQASGTLIVGHMPLEHLQAILELLPTAILVDHPGDPRLACPYQSVGFDNIEAARLAVQHLIAGGRKRIALLKGAPDHYFSRAIEQGYREALELAGLEVDAALVCHCDFTVGGAAEATRAFVDRDVAFDAVFASDESAIGVLRVLHERGLRCPEEVAVAGCDGLPIGEFTIPKLTTVKLNYGELGRVAVARVVELHEGESIPSRIRLVPELLIRESTPPIEPGED